MCSNGNCGGGFCFYDQKTGSQQDNYKFRKAVECPRYPFTTAQFTVNIINIITGLIKGGKNR